MVRGGSSENSELMGCPPGAHPLIQKRDEVFAAWESRDEKWYRHIRMVSCSQGTEKQNRLNTEMVVRFSVTRTGGPDT